GLVARLLTGQGGRRPPSSNSSRRPPGSTEVSGQITPGQAESDPRAQDHADSDGIPWPARSGGSSLPSRRGVIEPGSSIGAPEGMMASRLSLDEKLAAIRRLRDQPPSPEQAAELRRYLGDRSNLVVAAAAAVVGQRALVELVPLLETAFDRFLVNPLKDDKLCRAKVALIQALDTLEHPRSEVFEKAAGHVQLEPVWGGSEDSAGPLRA